MCTYLDHIARLALVLLLQAIAERVALLEVEAPALLLTVDAFLARRRVPARSAAAAFPVFAHAGALLVDWVCE